MHAADDLHNGSCYSCSMHVTPAMVDVAWKKFIIKVECERSSNSESSREPGTTVYFCRTCPSFRTQSKEIADAHLSKEHKVASDPASLTRPHHASLLIQSSILDRSLVSKTNSEIRIKADEDAPVSTQEPVDEVKPNLNSTSELRISPADVPSPNSPLAPNSPLSPLLKEVLGNTRKRITITLSTSPATAAMDIAALLPSSEESQQQLSSEPPCDSLSDLLDAVYSPSSDTSPHIFTVYPCALCGHKYARLSGLEKHHTREHGSAPGDGKTGLDRASPTLQNCLRAQPIRVGGPHFTCGHCDRVFATKQACDLHSRYHNNEKKFKCALCSVSFVQMNSLKRHTVAIHGIVPEPAYLDNPDDKDFELTDDMNSDSDDSTRSHRTTHSRKRKTGDANSNVPPNPRGRKKRSAGWLQSLEEQLDRCKENKPIPNPNLLEESGPSELRQEIRYRTILPRPSRGGAITTPKPITINRPRRSRRTHKLDPSSFDRGDVLTPMLCDTLVRGRRTTSKTDPTAINNQHSSVYTNSTGIFPNVIAIDPQHGQYNIPYCDLDAIYQTNETVVTTKPTHVLTVAAAFASQLPAGSTTENTPAGSNGDGNEEIPTSGSTAAYSLTSSTVLPGVQIYPTPWQLTQSQQVVGETGTTEVTATSQFDSSTTICLASPEYIQSTMTQQPVQLYPVLGPDGQTTLYYLAAPMEFVPNSEGEAGEQGHSAYTVSSPDAYYTQYSQPTIAWVSDPASTGLHSFQNPATAIANSFTSTTDPGDSIQTSFVTDSSQNLTTTAEHVPPENDSLGPEDNALSSGDPTYVNELVTSIFPGYTSSHMMLPETIEVIDLDASKYSSQFNETSTTIPNAESSESYPANPCSDACDSRKTELDTQRSSVTLVSSTAEATHVPDREEFCTFSDAYGSALDHLAACAVEHQNALLFDSTTHVS